MIRKPVHAARNESAPAQTVHRPLHRRRITKGVFTFRAYRNASHEKDRSMRAREVRERFPPRQKSTPPEPFVPEKDDAVPERAGLGEAEQDFLL